MYHNLQFSKKMMMRAQYSKNLTITDFILILVASGVSWLMFAKLVSPFLQALAPAETATIFYLMLSPSSVYDKKNYQMLIQIVRKARHTYHAIERPVYQFQAEKGGERHGQL